ncbi:MAG: PAS domain S-box protein [Candidatus Omnitrophica bacterium]|nr:PAS domain S-box protein [Candidatus Omnitrophota bacterium]
MNEDSNNIERLNKELQALEARLKELQTREAEFKLAEGRLKEASAELEIRVKVRTAELTKANEELRREIIERKRAEEMLTQSEKRYRAIVEDQTELICRFLPGGILTFINGAYCRYFNKGPEELIGKSFMPLISEDDREAVEKNLSLLGPQNPVVSHEERVIAADGSIRWQQWTNRAIVNNEGKVVEYQAVGRDITERKIIEEALRESEDKYRRLFDTANDAIFIADPETAIIVDANKRASELIGIPQNEIIGMHQSQLHPPDEAEFHRRLFQKHVKAGGAFLEEARLITRDGLKIQVEISASRVQIGGRDLLLGIFRDITERKSTQEALEVLNKELLRSNEKLKQLSLKDPLTELYSHSYLQEIIEAELHRARRHAHSLSVIMVDIDYFKSINDVYGHQFGDLILKQFSRQLKRMVRRYDIVVRFGGEEFVVISPDIDRQEALAQAQRILQALNLYNFGDKKHAVKLKLSLALASYPEDKVAKGIDLISLTDKILNKVKESGGNRVFSSLDIKTKKKTAAKPGQLKDVKVLRSRIEKLTKKANESLMEAIFAFAKTIELKDHYTGNHVENTMRFAAEIAKELELPKDEIELVREAAILHDLGKIGISEKILLKRSRLTRQEFEEIKKHPQIGADIIRPIQFLHDLIPYILYHHERWDGKGYPSGIRGEEIPVGARIIAIADVYQALTSDRPYRKAFSKREALKIIKDGSGSQFDPRIADIFLNILGKEKS